MNKIELFLQELRESSDIIYQIFTKGSCFRLFKIIKTLEPNAKPYWSDMDGHTVVKIDNDYYDIGGKVNKNYVIEKNYVEIPENLIRGYSLLKWVSREDEKFSVTVEKYKDE